MTTEADRLYALLPAVYRTRDAENGGPLRGCEVVAAQAEVVAENIRQLYDELFVETCRSPGWSLTSAASSGQCPLRDLRRGPAGRGGRHHRLPSPEGDTAGIQQVAADVSGEQRGGRAVLPAADHHREHAPRSPRPRCDRRPGAAASWSGSARPSTP